MKQQTEIQKFMPSSRKHFLMQTYSPINTKYPLYMKTSNKLLLGFFLLIVLDLIVEILRLKSTI